MSAEDFSEAIAIEFVARDGDGHEVHELVRDGEIPSIFLNKDHGSEDGSPFISVQETLSRGKAEHIVGCEICKVSVLNILGGELWSIECRSDNAFIHEAILSTVIGETSAV